MKLFGEVTGSETRTDGSVTVRGRAVKEIKDPKKPDRIHYFAVDIEGHEARAYPTGRRVIVTIKPRGR